MVFSSLTFSFAYLPVTLAVYFLAPLRWRNLVLLLVSLFFYGWGEPVYIVIMFVSIFIDYTHGLLVEKYRSNDRKARWFVGQSIVFNLLLLGFFKYGTFFAENLYLLTGISIPEQVTLWEGFTIPLLNIPLPIGISFYTFQTMSYTIDVYRGDAPVQRSIVKFGTFVTMFPQLVAGPIVRYREVAAELKERVNTTADFAAGAGRFTVGLAKKVLLANSIGALWDAELAAQSAGMLTAFGGWLGIAAYGFQIYFDFSGYSDMAIGLGKMFGFEFQENFNYPYTAGSVQEFWHRWHISLSTWFKEYVYIPLGGNRKGLPRQLFNILVVWMLTGIWHGAGWNFLFWGLWFAFFLILEKLFLGDILESVPKVFGRIYTLAVVLISWVFFALESPGEILAYLQAMFGMNGIGPVNSLAMFLCNEYLVLLVIALVACLPLGSRLVHALKSSKTGPAMALYRLGEKVIPAVLLLLSVAYIVDASYNPFLYFRF